MKKLKLIHLFLLLNIIGILSFVILNYITHGYFFEQVFFKLTDDVAYDFFVFLNGTSTSTSAFTAGSNPPLVRFIFRFIFKSLPESTQDMYPSVNLNPTLGNDLRVNAFAFLCFWIMFTFAIVLMAKLCSENLNGSIVEKNLFVIFSLISTGVIWAIERGNIVIWAMVCTMYFCFNFESENKTKREISYLLLGIAVSIKIYPALFCLFLLKKKDYIAILKTIGYVFVFTVLPLALSGGIPTILGYIDSLLNQVSSSSNLRAGYLNGLSILLTICRALGIEGFYLNHIWVFRILNYVFCIVISFLSVYTSKKMWIKVTTLIFAMFLLPGITHTYMLSFIIIPLIMFFNEEKEFNVSNIFALIGFLILTTVIPIGNGEIVNMLRDEKVVNVANRLSGIMLLHILGEIILTCIIFVDIIKAIVFRIKNKNFENTGM